jgi:hypothetical protein
MIGRMYYVVDSADNRMVLEQLQELYGTIPKFDHGT